MKSFSLPILRFYQNQILNSKERPRVDVNKNALKHPEIIMDVETVEALIMIIEVEAEVEVEIREILEEGLIQNLIIIGKIKVNEIPVGKQVTQGLIQEMAQKTIQEIEGVKIEFNFITEE